MGDIRIVVDLPDENMLKALSLQPLYAGYGSAKLKAAVKRRLSAEFPRATAIKVNIAPTNGLFGIDVVGTRAEDVLDAMKKASEVISSVIREESANETVK
jgi:hypothetical protein